MNIRPLAAADHAWFLDLNQACLPAVSALNPTTTAKLIGEAGYARLLVKDGQPLGALLAFWPAADYDSPNFLWFKARYDSFLYIDRVMVAEEARGQGVGLALYNDLFAFAKAHANREAGRVTCEINSRPPNPGSLRFHESLGFMPVGEQETEGGAKAVIMMEKRV